MTELLTEEANMATSVSIIQKMLRVIHVLYVLVLDIALVQMLLLCLLTRRELTML